MQDCQLSDVALERSGQARCHDVIEGSPQDTCCNEGTSFNEKPAGKTKRRRRTNERLLLDSPGEHQLGAYQSISVDGPISTTDLHYWTTAPRRESTDLPCCTVPPTFYSAPRNYTQKRRMPGKRSVLQQHVTRSYNLSSGISNRMLLHPSFQSYYTAVARLGSGAKEPVCGPSDTCKESPQQQDVEGERDQSVLPINTCDFFYTDPLLPPGHRVYNCLSSHSLQVFKTFRLETPAPIMSVCERPSLPALNLAGHIEEHVLDGNVHTEDDTLHRGKKKTKWLSLAEYNALNALLDMPHHESAHCADSLPLSGPTLCTLAQVHDISTSSSSTASTSEVRRGDTPAWDGLGFGFSSTSNPLHSQGQDHHKIRIPNVWNESEQSSQVARSMDMHMPQTHIETQRNHATPGKSSLSVNTDIGIPPCQSSRKRNVKSQRGKDRFGVLTPMYQLKIHDQKKHEPSERMTADEVTGSMRIPEPVIAAVADCRPIQYSMKENDAAVTMLELHSLLPVDEGEPLSSDTPITY